MEPSTTEKQSSITILRGAGAQARARTWVGAEDQPTLTLESDTRRFVPWGAMRRLLAAAAEHHSEARLQAALSTVVGRLSVCLPSLRSGLQPEQERERKQNTAVARFPFSDPVSTAPLADAWAELFATLFDEAAPLVIVPDSNEVDPESWPFFASLLRRRPGTRIVLGQPPRDASWSRLRTRVAYVGRQHLGRLESLHNVEVRVIECEGSEKSAADSPPTSAFHPLDDDADHRALDLAKNGISTASDVALVVAAIERAFDAQAFATVSHLASALHRSGAHVPDRARVLMFEAIANETLTLQEPRLAPDDPWVQEIESTYWEALPELRDPEALCHAQYRLTLYAIAKRNLDSAAELSQAALRSAFEIAPELRPLYRGYAQNVVALVSFKQLRVETALAQSEATLEIFEAGRNRDGLPTREIDIARFKVMNNLARLEAGRGRDAAAQAWVTRSQEVRAGVPLDPPFFTWISHSIYLEALEPRASHLEDMVRAALADWDEYGAAKLAYNAASLRYLLGEGEKALELYELTHQLWSSHLADTPDNRGLYDVLGTKLNCLVTAYHSGNVERGLSWLAQIRQLAATLGDSSMHVDLLAMEANLEASRGNHQTARQLSTAVMAELAEMGEDPVGSAALHRELGNIALHMGDTVLAGTHFRDALELTREHREEGFRPIDEISALAGLLEARRDALVSLPALLELTLDAIEDENVWGELPRVMRGLARNPSAVLERGSDLASRRVLALCRLSAQRADCADAVQALRAAASEATVTAAYGLGTG